VQVSALRVGVFWLRRLFGGSEVQWHSSGYVDLANFGSESETCVGSRVRLVGVSISFKKNFLSALIHSPPLSASLYRSFKGKKGHLTMTGDLSACKSM
jgi:hypothetical protein